MKLVCVPAGSFLMGSDKAKDASAKTEEMPQHTVTLAAYWIDSTEVTTGMYQKCVADGYCTTPNSIASNKRTSYYGDSQYANFPMTSVVWEQADRYCTWAGRRLPSEAEWEKAARGTDGRIYPWGSQAPDNTRANYNNQTSDTTAVGSYPAGASPYGALDMLGNVWEFAHSTYRSYPYSATDGRENTTPSDSHAERGGFWGNDATFLRAASRYTINSTGQGFGIGFRCGY